MVREFGALLVVGVALSLAFALSAGTAALVVGRQAADGPLARSARGAGELLGAAWRPVGRALAPVNRAGGGRVAQRCVARSGGRWRSSRWGWSSPPPAGSPTRAPRWSPTSTGSCPQDLRAVRDLHTLEEQDRHRRRDRRRRGGPGPHRAGGREVDARLPGRAWSSASATRPTNGCGARGAVPRAVAARPVPHRRSRPTAATASARCSPPCRRTSRRR